VNVCRLAISNEEGDWRIETFHWQWDRIGKAKAFDSSVIGEKVVDTKIAIDTQTLKTHWLSFAIWARALLYSSLSLHPTSVMSRLLPSRTI
jgi:hypothetical protein